MKIVDRKPIDEAVVARTVQELAKSHAAHAPSFVDDPGATIRPDDIDMMSLPPSQAPVSARPPPPPRLSQQGPALEMGETLGQGGMGVVRQAVQRSLDRSVAVKSLQPHFRHPQGVAMMLQEAHVMSHLEHPNVLPIYDLQYDDDGLPLIVLKKVEGTEWLALMRDGDEVQRRFGETDLLEWNLRVLMQACNAVHFAHSRGIIHRDLKPENIMIGEFGEVYVMDWGLALSLRDDGSSRLPLAENARELAGTPAYMAPEMVGGQQLRLGERTDVYLLGAMLYEVIMRRPPHVGATIEELLASVVRSAPSFDDDAPAELVAICREAMDSDPGWRHESAESLRLAINRFLQHSGSHRLVEQASRVLKLLTAELADDSDEDAGGRALRIYDHFGEVRFAYRQALAIWPRNDAASQGLQAATRAVLEHELESSNPQAAALLAASLEDPEPALVERVRLAVSRKERQTSRLETLGRQLDPRTNARARVIGAVVLGGVWTLAPLLTPLLAPATRTHLETTGTLVVILVGLLALAFLGRKEFAESALTRWLVGAAIIALVATISLEFAGVLLGLSVPETQAIWPLIWGCVSAMLAIMVDLRIMVMALGYFACMWVSAIWPEQRWFAMAAANAVLTIVMTLVWIPRRRTQ